MPAKIGLWLVSCMGGWTTRATTCSWPRTCDGIALGEEWQQRLHERLRWADAVVCVVTSAYLASRWCTAEASISWSRGSRLLPLRAEPGVADPLLTSVQHTDYTRDPAAARAALDEALRRVDAPSIEDYHRAYAGFGAEWPGDAEIGRRHIVAADTAA
ncbi:MAG: toll/interleukin-1 receptor domain-containing protein [Pseudonocardiaceae bacterium]